MRKSVGLIVAGTAVALTVPRSTTELPDIGPVSCVNPVTAGASAD